MPRPLNSNVPAFNLAISTLLRNPSLLVPNYTIPTFLQLPEDNLGSHLIPPSYFSSPSGNAKKHHFPPKIRALVIDKDNTLTPPESRIIPPAYMQKLKSLRTKPSSPFNMHKNPHGILIVSNTAGSDPNMPLYEEEAKHLESILSHLGIPVFRSGVPLKAVAPGQTTEAPPKHHPLKKPFSFPSILAHLRAQNAIDSPDEVAVVGDRLGTDVIMAGLMGSWSIWTQKGVTVGVEGDDEGREGMDFRGTLAKWEVRLERYLRRRGVAPAMPKGWEGGF
ncbi:HAD phosphatase, family IIIA [Helicocarpus griseus UAMH5409]|uniref:HAD phosphatase, family IIIA n=1 Tax=Helicocarpus griseus UAMH5409 TaxID=1447875 RepID=A0A2B7Y7Y0_9EURO|nr:HAD phosphatase, family IIIA [Helicocarpus griseus UAMH5409]